MIVFRLTVDHLTERPLPVQLSGSNGFPTIPTRFSAHIGQAGFFLDDLQVGRFLDGHTRGTCANDVLAVFHAEPDMACVIRGWGEQGHRVDLRITYENL